MKALISMVVSRSGGIMKVTAQDDHRVWEGVAMCRISKKCGAL